MKCGNVYISPKSWDIIMQDIINEEMKEKMIYSEKECNFVKNFRIMGLTRVEEIGKSAAEKACGFIRDMTGNHVETKSVNVMITTPLEIKEEKIKNDYKIVTGINFSGDINGIGVLIFSEDCALKLSKSMLAGMGMEDYSDELDEMKISALNETCNLIISAYVDTIANFMDISLNMSPPFFIKGIEYEIIENIFGDCGVNNQDLVLTFKSGLFSQGIGSGFEVLIVMPPNSINTLFKKL
ncbi:chemotaxis protein CheC [Methanothermococcus okinawensis]|uniref:CheC, inhibitor of MCP methylation n=1 Tax=Methanothermococcus okinawensis (strain DSM 14208 / JCM 11175 / IH1) TaxID=647113 RepID=F8AK17_METOI|nr:chemotaxis protein CheC [Methanothermococcus okinawensis]AEH07378.1 CheC, inhibitor of MCP methylation [Methanothermococcus okinawensis IH1]